MFSFVHKLFTDLTTDNDGRFLATKIGEVVAGVVWTFYMVTNQPDSVEMWLAYAATVMGWSSIKYAVKKMNTKGEASGSPTP